MYEELMVAGLFAAMFRLATPVLFASIGETYAERSGVLNLGLEGAMISGAFFGFVGVLVSAMAQWESASDCWRER